TTVIRRACPRTGAGESGDPRWSLRGCRRRRPGCPLGTSPHRRSAGIPMRTARAARSLVGTHPTHEEAWTMATDSKAQAAVPGDLVVVTGHRVGDVPQVGE